MSHTRYERTPNQLNRVKAATLVALMCLSAPNTSSDDSDKGTVYVVHAIDTETIYFLNRIYSQNLQTWIYDVNPDPDFSFLNRINNAMTDSYRDGNRDSFGDRIKLSWFLMTHEAYCHSTQQDCNIIHTKMEKYTEKAEVYDDVYGWHYHHADWTDQDGDGVFFWNQLLTFNNTNYSHGRDVELAEKMLSSQIVEHGFYPSVFRSGWDWENTDFSNWLDDILPFDYSSFAPNYREVDRADNWKGYSDWRIAPDDWSFYHPSSIDYQIPGNLKRTVFRCYIDGKSLDYSDAFRRADSGKDVIVCSYKHSYHRLSFESLGELMRLRQEYPEVKVKYVNALEGAKIMLGYDDDVPPTVVLHEVNHVFTLSSSEPLFSYPYGAAVDSSGNYFRVKPVNLEPDISSGRYNWIFDLSDIDYLVFAVGGSDIAGNTFVTSAVPSEYDLLQNYPNPFNQGTTVQFDLPVLSHVNILVYNILGQQVTSLLDETRLAGRHTVHWDGTDCLDRTVSTGIYLYRITAGDFVAARKMLLLK